MMKNCPLCHRELMAIELCYPDVGCGDEKCPGKEEFWRLYREAERQYQIQLSGIDTTKIHSWKDLKDDLIL